METRIVRFHNIYGPHGTYDGGREKAPGGDVPQGRPGEDGGEIEIWGDGEQTRSFCYIDDCVEGIYRLMQSDHREPLNLGTDRMVTINELAAIIIGIAGQARHLDPAHRRARRASAAATPTTPGCARSSAGSRRSTSSRGFGPTYRWIEQQVRARRSAAALVASAG